MKHSVPHDLGAEQAKKVTLAAIDAYTTKFAKYNPAARWDSDTRCVVAFKAKGIGVEGKVTILERSIDMELDVPFLLKPFQGQAIGIIEREVRVWIEKARRGEF